MMIIDLTMPHAFFFCNSVCAVSALGGKCVDIPCSSLDNVGKPGKFVNAMYTVPVIFGFVL